jgi:hypothetical protein
MGGRVAIDEAPDGDAVVRIRPTTYRRLVEAFKYSLVSACVFGFLAALRVGSSVSPSEKLAGVALCTAAVGILALVRSGETVTISPGVVHIVQALDSFEIARSEQSVPTYSPIPSRVWASQRWASEKGSGVLLFGDASRGVRFGMDLTEVDAALVLQAFDRPEQVAPVPPLAFWQRRMVWILSDVMPIVAMMIVIVTAYGLDAPDVVVYGLFALAGLVSLWVMDYLVRRFPERITL